MAPTDDDAPHTRPAADLVRHHLQDIATPTPAPSERADAIKAIAQALRQRGRRAALARAVGGFAILIMAAFALAILFAG